MRGHTNFNGVTLLFIPLLWYGVAIYTRDILNVREMSSFVPENIEAVCLEIIKPTTQPILITTVYRPPSFNTNFMDNLENYLHVLDGQNKELILT